MCEMTKQEINILVRELKKIFDIVRLVDVTITTQYSLDKNGELIEEPFRCFSVWNKNERCENCISAKAFSQKTQMTKFEFINHDVYHVISKYVEIDGTPYMLEMVSKLSDETLFSAYGQEQFVDTISTYNRKLYVDSLTGAYNRRYFEDQLLGLKNEHAVAMMDVDNFKMINDTYGHKAGDKALKTIVNTIQKNMRNTDALIRYGGDEFLIVFSDVAVDVFGCRLESIRKAVHEIVMDEYPQLRLSLSIGGIYSINEDIDFINEADKMLYDAKKSKNVVRYKTLN